MTREELINLVNNAIEDGVIEEASDIAVNEALEEILNSHYNEDEYPTFNADYEIYRYYVIEALVDELNVAAKLINDVFNEVEVDCADLFNDMVEIKYTTRNF